MTQKWRKQICPKMQKLLTGGKTCFKTLKVMNIYRQKRQQQPFTQNGSQRASLVAQWWRTHLPMYRTWARSLVWEDPTYHGTTKSWATTTEPTCLEPELHKSSHRSKPADRSEEQPPFLATGEKPEQPKCPSRAKNKWLKENKITNVNAMKNYKHFIKTIFKIKSRFKKKKNQVKIS